MKLSDNKGISNHMQYKIKLYFYRFFGLTLICSGIAIMVLVFTPIRLSWPEKYTKEEIERSFEPLTSKYGIKIVYEIGPDFLYQGEACTWLPGPHKDSKVKRISDRDLIRSAKLLTIALEKYPVDVIRKYLHAIHFAKEINQNGLLYGGSYDFHRKVIFIVDNGHEIDNYASQVFHHEFSSLLLNSHTFFLYPWLDYNPDDFVYLNEIYGNLREVMKNVKISASGTNEDYEKGFINIYGQTNFENDFNEYADMVFTNPEKFRWIMSKYPRVRGKFLFFQKFYHDKIDPVFTEEYLLGLEPAMQ